MADKTTNYGLTKPNPEDFYDVQVQNENMDIIDRELKNRTPSLATYYPANSGKNVDELIDPFALIPVSLDVNTELFNIVGGTFAWVWTNFYIDATVTSRRMQIAMTYNAVNHKMAFRIYGANGWLEWKELATADGVPSNVLLLDGSVPMTGNMKIKKNTPTVILEDTGDGTGSAQYSIDKLLLRNITDGGTVELEIHDSETELASMLQLVVNNESWYNLYGEHNKPSPAEIGAVSSAPVKLTSANDLNQIITNGYYYWRTNNKPANVPTENGADSLTAMRVWTEDGVTCTQEIMDMYSGSTHGCVMRRTVDGDEVYPWEWVNPPMEIGVEYRTVERHEAEPVFVTLLSNGTVQKRTDYHGIIAPKTENWTFTLEDGSTVTKAVYVG